ncbi:MAG: hypothetical protein HJJLKODD_02222 [Phycisphaerae bacterium]|nr:hypothetical protein [Phycisphaerae bacterium]
MNITLTVGWITVAGIGNLLGYGQEIAPTTQPAIAPTATQSKSLLEDPALKQALTEASESGIPHRELLASTITRILEEQPVRDLNDFKIGALTVLRHSNNTENRILAEMYLRLLQYPLIREIEWHRRTAEQIKVDGQRKDWPAEALMNMPARKSSKDDYFLTSFGVVRGDNRLTVLFELNQRPSENEARLTWGLELTQLAEGYQNVAYLVNINQGTAQVFDAAGKELPSPEAAKITYKSTGRVTEVELPLVCYNSDLRSVCVRGYVQDVKKGEAIERTPWVAAQTGTITTPTELLIALAAKRELPADNPLPVAIALQEGLLLSRCNPDLAEQVRKDSSDFLELALDIDERLGLAEQMPLSKMTAAAQLSWACRYDGYKTIATSDEYKALVVSPRTLADMRGYAEVNGWLGSDTLEQLRFMITQFMGTHFKSYDFPDADSRRKGAEYIDDRPDAYYEYEGKKYLAYRDVDINLRWAMFVYKNELKGNWEQGRHVERMLAKAIGLVSVSAGYHAAGEETAFNLVFDSKIKRWFPLGGDPEKTDAKAKYQFHWCRPWQRPERFVFWNDQPEKLPEGICRGLLQSAVDEVSGRQLATNLSKGIPDNQIEKLLLMPIDLK